MKQSFCPWWLEQDSRRHCRKSRRQLTSIPWALRCDLVLFCYWLRPPNNLYPKGVVVLKVPSYNSNCLVFDVVSTCSCVVFLRITYFSLHYTRDESHFFTADEINYEIRFPTKEWNDDLANQTSKSYREFATEVNEMVNAECCLFGHEMHVTFFLFSCPCKRVR